MDTLDRLPKPFFSYIHLFSPHAPYRARRDFIGIFNESVTHIRKPDHVFTEGESYETIEQNRIWYEEYIANVDFEFGRLLDHLEKTGALENSYLLVTSDHGELLERGVKGHVTPLLYEPLVRIPLLISTPGRALELTSILQPAAWIYYQPCYPSPVKISPTGWKVIFFLGWAAMKFRNERFTCWKRNRALPLAGCPGPRFLCGEENTKLLCTGGTRSMERMFSNYTIWKTIRKSWMI